MANGELSSSADLAWWVSVRSKPLVSAMLIGEEVLQRGVVYLIPLLFAFSAPR